MLFHRASLDVSRDLVQAIARLLLAHRIHLLIDTDRIHDRGGQRYRWYSGKHRRHGGLVQVVCNSDGRPLWVSPVEPGSTHDLTAARVHALPALYAASHHCVPTLADKACTGAGAGIRVPVRRPNCGQVLDPSTKAWNAYVDADRAFVEHGIAHLKTRWRASARVTLCPWRISDIAATALVLSGLENRY